MNQENTSISPIYVLSIFLSIPAGLILPFLLENRTSLQHFGIAIFFPIIVVAVAYFHTRSRGRHREG